jgi:hypothetical protein
VKDFQFGQNQRSSGSKRNGQLERANGLFRYTGLRRGDAAQLGKQHIREGAIVLDTQKTGTRVTIPILPELQRTLDASPVGDLQFIGLTKEGLGNLFRQACDVAGISKSALYSLPYDVQNDFVPISPLVTVPYICTEHDVGKRPEGIDCPASAPGVVTAAMVSPAIATSQSATPWGVTTSPPRMMMSSILPPNGFAFWGGSHHPAIRCVQ